MDSGVDADEVLLREAKRRARRSSQTTTWPIGTRGTRSEKIRYTLSLHGEAYLND